MFTVKLLAGWNPWSYLLIAAGLAGFAWVLYRRELRSLGLGAPQWIIPLLRALAIFLIVLTLAEPAIESRQREGEPGHVHFLLDGSTSMSISDQLDSGKLNSQQSANRLGRAVAGLITPTSGVCDQVAGEFDISIWRADAADNVLLWQSSLDPSSEVPRDNQKWTPNQWSPSTAIGDRLSELRELIAGNEKKSDQKISQSVVVLMSDGQSNFGSTVQSATEALSKSNIAVTAVGFGPENEPNDLILKAFETPERLYKTDQLSGRLVLADTLPAGANFEAQIVLDGDIIWQQSFQAQSQLQREIRFDLPLSKVLQRVTDKLPANVQYNSLPLKLTARLVSSGNEQSAENNSLDAHLTVGASKAKVLLIDGRSRWETRYIKNLFARDPAWQITTLISEEDDSAKLPQSRSDWMAYNLVVLGDVPASNCNPSLQASLADFVNRGGGLIVSDGARRHLHAPEFATLSTLLPIRLNESTTTSKDAKWNSQLTSVGQRLAALNLTSNELKSANLSVEPSDKNAQFWKQLPKLEFLQPVSLATGSETLAEATHDGLTQPLMVVRRFGAGQVLYVASDETWRWRFKVADQIHQRLWNQMARWVMRKPMSIESEYLSLDSGAASYKPGTAIEIRAALRQQDGSPAQNRKVIAILTRDGQAVTRVNLPTDDVNPGSYNGTVNNLPVGEYQVAIEAEGFTKDGLTAKSRFAVVQPNLSMELLSTTCDAATLQSIGQGTGGSYIHESQLDKLAETLRPLSGGKIVHSTQLIWQSYYWFLAALALLAIEWVLRKRAGLI
jgi:von Willebrand factor type A domain